jgi:hypothetical protein
MLIGKLWMCEDKGYYGKFWYFLFNFEPKIAPRNSVFLKESQPIEWERIFESYISDIRLIYRIYNKLIIQQ